MKRIVMRGALVVLMMLVGCRDRAATTSVDASAASSVATTAPSMDPAPSASTSSDEPPPAPPIDGGTTGPAIRAAESMGAAANKPTFRKSKVDIAEIARVFATIPALARVATNTELFDPNEGAFLVRSEAPHPGIVFTTTPLIYSPEPEMELLVVTGHAKATSFIVALSIIDGTYRLASSFLMLHDNAPIALAYSDKGKRLWWTSCWNCPGEQGALRITDDHKVIIVQQ